MFLFLCTVGAGAITFLISEKCAERRTNDWVHALMELIAYTAIDTAVTLFIMKPINKIQIVIMPNGVKNLQYGLSGFVCALVIAVIWGVVIGAVKKHVDMKVQILPKEDSSNEKKNEKE